MDWALTALVNLIVGLLIGWCGVAGFLLPIYFTGYLGLPVQTTLALSFFDFTLSGAVGAWNFHRKDNLDLRAALLLGAGSLCGALAGVWLNSLLPPGAAKLLLYIVVLASGASILLREYLPKGEKSPSGIAKQPITGQPLPMVLLGLATGTICSLSGAGGPVLVMPLLVVLGMGVHMAIGVALLDSVFISLPAFIGYAAGGCLSGMGPMLLVCGVCHTAGVFVGSLSAHKIRQKPLKTGVAVFSVALAIYMLATL